MLGLGSAGRYRCRMVRGQVPGWVRWGAPAWAPVAVRLDVCLDSCGSPVSLAAGVGAARPLASGPCGFDVVGACLAA